MITIKCRLLSFFSIPFPINNKRSRTPCMYTIDPKIEESGQENTTNYPHPHYDVQITVTSSSSYPQPTGPPTHCPNIPNMPSHSQCHTADGCQYSSTHLVQKVYDQLQSQGTYQRRSDCLQMEYIAWLTRIPLFPSPMNFARANLSLSNTNVRFY